MLYRLMVGLGDLGEFFQLNSSVISDFHGSILVSVGMLTEQYSKNVQGSKKYHCVTI